VQRGAGRPAAPALGHGEAHVARAAVGAHVHALGLEPRFADRALQPVGRSVVARARLDAVEARDRPHVGERALAVTFPADGFQESFVHRGPSRVPRERAVLRPPPAPAPRTPPVGPRRRDGKRPPRPGARTNRTPRAPCRTAPATRRRARAARARAPSRGTRDGAPGPGGARRGARGGWRRSPARAGRAGPRPARAGARRPRAAPRDRRPGTPADRTMNRCAASARRTPAGP